MAEENVSILLFSDGCINAFHISSTEKNVVAGIIYLHKISEIRINEPPLRRLRTFETLCGGSLPEKVLLVTTMWNEVDQEQGSDREEQIRTKYWNPATNMARFEDTNDTAQAWRAVNMLLERLG